MTVFILNVAFFDSGILTAKSGVLAVRGCDGGTWTNDLSAEYSIEYYLNYINNCGSLISNGCNIELDGELIGTTEY